MSQFRPKHAPHLRYWECAIAARNAADDEDRRKIWAFCAIPDPLHQQPAPQCGYWKVRWSVAGARIWKPAAIWLDGEEMVGSVGTQRQGDLDRLWQRCGSEPISYETYSYALKHGHFPGEIDAVAPQLDNYADDPGAKLRDDLIELIGKVELYIKSCGEPLTQEAADSLANYLDMIRLAEKTAGETLKAEIAEQKAEIARRQEIWALPIDAAQTMAKRLRDLLTPFLRGKKAVGQDAKVGGQAGKRVSLRTVWRARVTDWDKVMVEFHNDPRVRELIQKILDACARSKDRDTIKIDGAEYYEEDTAG
jgi:hypothetical protein